MIKIIFRIATIILISILVYYEFKAHWRGREGPSEEIEENYAGYVPYSLVDSIASERERVRNIEDLISLTEASMEEESESGITVNFTDASGEYHFRAEADMALLEYLYAERRQIRKEISEKIRTISN